jgi:lysophospholipase L1-like esterase
MTPLWEQALRAALLPVLIAQALQVRRKALRLPEAAGPRDGVAGKGPVLRLLIAGDSSAAGVGVATQDQALAGRLVAAFEVHWRLEARTGADTAETLHRLAGLDGAFDVVVSALGVNDVTGLVHGRVWMERQRLLSALARERFGARLIVTSGLPPMGRFPLLPQPLRWVLGRQAARFDAGLANLAAAAPDIAHVRFDLALSAADMAEDGYHPGAAIYAEWAKVVAGAIRARLTARG